MSHFLDDKMTQSAFITTSALASVYSSQTDEMPPESEKGSDAGHGNRFQSKLLMLFCIRAINAGYKFYLGTELLDQGNKFDDLIFKYTKDKIAEDKGDHWPYQYLQAKSRLNEKVDKIVAKELFTLKKADFGLPKYFRSYLEITRRGDIIDSCIICTNIDFENKQSLQKNGIKVNEVQLADPILKFEKLSDDKIPTRYKIKIQDKKLKNILKEETASKLLAKMLRENEQLNSKFELIRNYHIALVKERVIEHGTQRFHADFINRSVGLSEGAKELHKNFLKLVKNDDSWKSWKFNFDKNFGKTPLEPKEFNYPLPVAVKDEEIDGFLDKLIFAVNTPNEDELDDVLKREMGNYFKLLTTDLQSAYVMHEMVNWFKRENNIWLSSEEAKELFLNKTQRIMESIRVNEISIDYQNQLKKDLMGIEFNNDSIQVMTETLRPLIEGTSSSVFIGSESPKHTAVKLIAAIKTIPNFKCDDSFLVTSSNRLDEETEIKKWKNCLDLKKDSHNLLIVVCDGQVSNQNYIKYANLFPDGRTDNKMNKVVIVSPDKTARITDEIKYMDLAEEFKKQILSLKVSFQLPKDWAQQEIERNKITVGDLIGNKPEEVIDFSSIKELMQTRGKVIIPSFDDTTHFEEHMYIKRDLKFPFHDKFEDELANSLGCTVNKLRGECRICPNGHIEWFIEEKRQREIWEKLMNLANQSSSSSGVIHQDNHLIQFKEDKKEKSVVIISGVAGTGKSTLLSHLYREIKRKKPDYWVIKINLVNHYEAIFKLNNFTVDLDDAFDFFVNQLHIVDDQSLFSRSLLRNRLKTGDRIVVMFDGFDEVNNLCQENVIQLMKAITKEKSIKFYLTTRPHMLDKLQFQLSQLAYSLENFTEKDQIQYLVLYWKRELNISGDGESFQQFAKSLVERVSETLRDKDKSFIGVPLQCRIIAECFQSELHTKIKQNNKDGTEKTDFENQLFSNFHFDLNSLYKLLMETKRQVFRCEKINFSNHNQILIDAVNRLLEDIENHLTKLAIVTLTADKKSADTLWSSHSSYSQLESEKTQMENRNNELGVQFGLIMLKECDGEKVIKTQFLHRTFAEYLFAKYLYEGIAVNHLHGNNSLLDNEPVRDLIVSQILVQDNYDGVRVFLNAMLKETIHSKEWLRVISEGIQVLPLRLQNFTIDMALQIRKPITFDSETCPVVLPSRFAYRSNPLSVSVYTGIENLFYFLCDCLDIVLEKIEVRQVLRSAFEKFSFSFPSFYFVNGGLFKRFIQYYDDADYLELQCITNSMLSGMMSTQYTLEFYDSTWNKKETKEIVKMLLDFIEQHKTVYMNEVMSPNELKGLSRGNRIVQMLHFFTFNEYYDSLFDQFFRLLSSMYLNDSDFINLLKYTLRMRDANNNNWAYPSNNGIGKTLTNLRNLERYKVMQGLSHLALVSDKKVFDQFYQPCRPIKDEDFSDLKWLSDERDSSRMTLLHRAAFYGDAESVNNILGTIRKYISFGTNKLLVESVVKNLMLARTDECFTPFYVAATCGHKEICQKMLSFLKVILTANDVQESLIDYYGFLHRATGDAILFGKVPMFKVILEAVNLGLGQDYLLALLTSSYPEIIKSTNRFIPKYNKVLFKITEEVFLQNGKKKGYKGLNKLALHSDPTLLDSRANIEKTLENLEDETLQGMLSALGLVNWTKRFLDLGIPRGFRFLSSHLLARFTSHQRSQFVEAITSPHIPIIPSYPEEMSYWAEWFVGYEFTADDFDCLDQLLKLITDNYLGETTDIQKLLFNDDGKDITRVLLCQNRKIVSIVSKYLPRTIQLAIKKYVTENGPEITNELFQSEEKIIRRQVLRNWVNILPFYNDRSGKKKFEKLVGALLVLHTERHRQSEVQYSFWSKYLDSPDEGGKKVKVVEQFLKCVSEKLGQRALRKVVLHKDCMGLVILGAELQEDKQLVNALLTHLSRQDRDCVNLLIMINSPFNSRRYRSVRSGEPCQCNPMNSCWCWH